MSQNGSPNIYNLSLRDVIAQSDYDVIFLQEVWYRSDHKLLRTALPYSTYFGSFNSDCSGVILPLGCSGLTILSRHPLSEINFTPFNVSILICTYIKCDHYNML